MRALLALVALCLLSGVAVAEDVYVHGYTRQDGTEVEPYHRTSPNSTPEDNYSYRGNENPYTGKIGTEQPKEDAYSRGSDYGAKGSNPYGYR